MGLFCSMSGHKWARRMVDIIYLDAPPVTIGLPCIFDLPSEGSIRVCEVCKTIHEDDRNKTFKCIYILQEKKESE